MSPPKAKIAFHCSGFYRASAVLPGSTFQSSRKVSLCRCRQAGFWPCCWLTTTEEPADSANIVTDPFMQMNLVKYRSAALKETWKL